MTLQTTPDAFRHGRMFELMRQSNQADATCKRVAMPHIHADDRAELVAFQQNAIHSLGAKAIQAPVQKPAPKSQPLDLSPWLLHPA